MAEVAARARVSQTELAAALRTSQSNVSRWAGKGRAAAVTEERPGRGAYEVIQRYAVGRLSRGQLVAALVAWPFEPSPQVDVQEWDVTPQLEVPGSFEATVARALSDGLLSEEDYDAVLDALADTEAASSSTGG